MQVSCIVLLHYKSVAAVKHQQTHESLQFCRIQTLSNKYKLPFLGLVRVLADAHVCRGDLNKFIINDILKAAYIT